MTQSGNTLESILAAARRTGTPLPLPANEPSLAEAYDVQRAIMRTTNLPVMVWKLALTTPQARDAFGTDEPIVGRLAASAILNNGTQTRQAWPEMFAEAELVFEIGHDLPPKDTPYTRETVLPAIQALYAGIELAAPRYTTSDMPLGLLVADNAMGHALVLGARLSAQWEDSYADMPVSIALNGEVQENGSTTRVMGNPLDALVWLANWLCDNGEGGLRREQLVSAGSCTGATPISAGDSVSAAFNGIEVARVSLLA
ncbi:MULTISPECIES: 2-keto-4-pentenoate hydratase [Novosphingobium]|uniref:2-keto-4-pentenoate hydratase n=1 Tax=Novosphingobium mathurense TaxID=428990 RepID=A0A1U6HGV6_9SPHN|nr:MULTISPECIES: fumarylacetoacetate hydrolase family protein [Novosphingobium]CDO38581.1 putative hydratase [Novosphingobium sp. KN65.2]SLJ95022.1 2-keto-4-pentenoate hydratase [Novosphingobium mathurense]